MAKKAPVKKSRRRLKRSVRRSLAAVLMITAIGVAAVPVPENEAAQERGWMPLSLPEGVPYGYPDDDDAADDIRDFSVKNDILDHESETDLTKAYTIKLLSDGLYQMDWQFKFYMPDGDESRGIIKDYNDTYQQDRVELKPNVTCGYVTVSATDFENFFKEEQHEALDNRSDLFTYSCNDPVRIRDIDQEFFNKYFKSQYDTYVSGYSANKAAYDEQYETWQEQYRDDLTSPEAVAAKPEEPSFSKKISDLTPDQRCEYYCENAENGKYKGCKLATVIDSEQAGTDHVTNTYVYIPQKMEGGSPAAALKFDDQGFVYTTDASIIGIGNGAFQDIRNVYYLTVPPEIKYIGVSAFEGSFLKEITFNNVQDVCDMAFKNCSDLTSVTIGAGTTKIGNECFYGSGITSVTFPSTIQKIGVGAFANCKSLQTVDFSGITGSDVQIGAYAFFNALGLNSVNFKRGDSAEVTVDITKIGKGAFAVDNVITGGLTEFVFPGAISNGNFGDYILAGRSNLLNVTMPSSYGSNTIATVPENTFYNCFNLQCVHFPESSGRAKFDDGLFATVTNPDFYVWGPELDVLRNPAEPRRSTWKAQNALLKPIPYRYDRGDQHFYEVSDGDYLMCIDDAGVLTSCTKNPDASIDGLVDLEIPDKVGDTYVTGIASDCFSDDELNQKISSLTIRDNSKLTLLNDGVCTGWGNLKEVYIGNSVTAIGANAFKDCTALEDVTFNTPSAGYEAFTVGADAFKTGSSKLTFHGDIVEGYAPFDWAMDPDNIIEDQDGIRVCYKSLSPTYLTVMYNPITDMVTLLDYPKYGEISTLLNDKYKSAVREADSAVDKELSSINTYEDMKTDEWYRRYAGTEYDGFRREFMRGWNDAAGDSAALNALYSSEFYGPWISPRFVTFCQDSDKLQRWLNDDTGALDWRDPGTFTAAVSGQRSLAGWLFEPITAYAADYPDPYYERNKYDVAVIVDANDPYRAATPEERDIVYYSKNIDIPAGVESIDVYGYRHDLTADGEENTTRYSNIGNYNTYLYGLDGWDFDSRTMYETSQPADEDGIRSVPGLFSGYFDDYQDSGASQEKRERGNDLITSVTMHSVKYLPDYAFDSCENLGYVILGDACADIGKAPFRGCYSMTTVGDNEYYTTVNGIIYSKNEDGSYTVEECLAARGNLVGPAVVTTASDPNLANITSIRPGAFEDCDYITEVNFGRRDVLGLKTIPEDCFKNCDLLQTVVLPMSATKIERGAFCGDDNLTGLTIYGNEVQISAGAFDSDKRATTMIRAYEDSAVSRYIEQYGREYKLQYDDTHPLGSLWQVSFYDANYALIGDLKDQMGNPLDNPQYVEDGAYAVVPENPTLSGWTFERWVGSNNVDLAQPIHEDSFFYAQGYSTNGTINGKYPVEFYDGVDGKQVGPTQYVDPGSDAVAPAHPEHAGYEPDGFSDTFTNVQSVKTIIMKYKAAATSGGSSSNDTTHLSGDSTSNTPNSSSNNSTASTNTTSNPASTSNTSNTSNANNTSDTSNTSSGTAVSSSNGSTPATASGLYVVTVNGGSGSGSYAAGATVLITANTPAAGSVFSKWVTTSQGVTLASVSTTPTTFKMPANDVTITAEYTTASAAANTGATPVSTADNGGSTRVDITKPGISNKDLASANVNGSTDNFVIKITETDEATAAVQAALTNKYGSLDNILYYAMDISLYDSTGTVKLTDTSGITVDITLPIPDALVAYGGNNMAGAVVNGNQLENLNENFTTINGVPCIRFTASHFSPYTIYVDTGNLTEGMLDATPKTGDPIHPKWFLSIGLACLSVILFIKKDKDAKVKTT